MSLILSAIPLMFAQATAVLGNSVIMLELAKKIQEKCIRLDSVKKVFLGGTSATHQTLREIEQSFDLAIVRSVYGSTETGEICAPPMSASNWYGIGFPAPMVQIKVRVNYLLVITVMSRQYEPR